MEMSEWVTVYTTPHETKAEIIKNALGADGVPCNLEGVNQAAEPGLDAIPVKIQVPARYAASARNIILRHEDKQSPSD